MCDGDELNELQVINTHFNTISCLTLIECSSNLHGIS